MDISTYFDHGDKVWVVEHSKATEIEVNVIMITLDAVYYGVDRYILYRGDECFVSKEELLKYVAGDD